MNISKNPDTHLRIYGCILHMRYAVILHMYEKNRILKHWITSRFKGVERNLQF
jgi:hypothetical protein